MNKFYTDDEMLEKCRFWAMVCLGGMSEGFDYSEAKAIMQYWGKRRSECHYGGGVAVDVNASQARAYLESA